MNMIHLRLLWFQSFILLSMAVLILIGSGFTYTFAGLILFVFLEFAVLEVQRREPAEAVYYRKSCLFAFADLFSVFWFMAVGILFAIAFFNKDYVPDAWHAGLFIYIAIRKLYISKNYYYEK